MLPEKYRISLKDRSTVKKHFSRPAIKEVERVDPSEAIRSAEILPLLIEYFKIRKKIDFGGTILHLVLQDIAGNFNHNNQNDMKLLEMLFSMEDTLMDMGLISSDFAVIIAQKNKD